MRYWWIIVVALFALQACEIAANKPVFEDIRFTDRALIRLDVAKIEIIDDYRAPLKAPYVEHTFPIPPEAVVRNWARDRLVAVGEDGLARFRIVDAAVRETKLKKETGLKSLFVNQQSERYDGQLLVELAVIKPGANALIKSLAKRSQTIADNITLNDRDRLNYTFTRELANDLDTRLEADIRKHMGRYLR